MAESHGSVESLEGEKVGSEGGRKKKEPAQEEKEKEREKVGSEGGRKKKELAQEGKEKEGEKVGTEGGKKKEPAQEGKKKEKTEAEIEIERLQSRLTEQDKGMEELLRERNNTIRELRKAKVKVTTPSDEARTLAKTAGPLDDAVFFLLGEDRAVMAEIISTIIGVPVVVKDVVPQYTIMNFGSRSVRLDNFSEIRVEVELLENCIWGKKGAIVDVEVQKEDNDDHEFRVYYNGASMIINRTPTGVKFEELPHAIVIFISAFDVFDEGKTLYQTIKVDKETLKPRKSPVEEYYVNTENLEIADLGDNEALMKVKALMRLFRDREYNDSKFPAFSERKRKLLETEEGVMEVSKEMQVIMDAYAAKKVDKEVDTNNIEYIRSLCKAEGWTKEQAMEKLGMSAEQKARYAQLI